MSNDPLLVPPPAKEPPPPLSPQDALNALVTLQQRQQRAEVESVQALHKMQATLDLHTRHLKWISLPMRIIFILIMLWLALNLIACLLLVFSGTIQRQFDNVTGNSSLPQLPSASVIAGEPEYLSITDPGNTGLAETFLEELQTALAGNAEVVGYEAEVRTLENLVVYVDLSLPAGSEHSARVAALEKSLYTFSRLGENAGMISIQACTAVCCDSAGMGQNVMHQIDWDSIEQQELFRTLDREIYSDDEVYSTAAFVTYAEAGSCR